jgi:[Skp1-protein]-hydroxyproline N-acetylglucosaminyltransferase
MDAEMLSQLAYLPEHVQRLIGSHAAAESPMQKTFGKEIDRDSLLPKALERLKGHGLVVVDGFLSRGEVKAVKAEAKSSLEEAGRAAGMGGGQSRWMETSLRGDRMRWCHAEEEKRQGRPLLAALIDKVQGLRLYLTQMGYDVSGRSTFQLACYPGGGSGYVRHSDSSESAKGRTLTAIVYLQEELWQRSDGGQLAVYHGVPHSSLDGEIKDEPYVSILPVSGRLVLFDSMIEHEVIPSLKDRWALTCWFYKPPLAPAPPMSSETIFVSIAAYRDEETRWMIHDLYQKASQPDRVTVGIVWQVDLEKDAELMKPVGGSNYGNHQVRETVMDYRDAEGPCLARHLAQQLWRGEGYYLQLDSHMRFVPGWDSICLQQLQAAEDHCGSKRVVLSTYPPDYHGLGASASIPDTLLAPVTLLCAQGFNSDGFLTFVAKTMKRESLRVDSPVPCSFWAAGFSFSRSHLIQEVPYSRELPHLFFGEEVYQLTRMWTRDWRIFAPSVPILFHKYERSSRLHTFQSDVLDPSIRRKSQEKVLRVLKGLTDEPEEGWRVGETWGLGTEHTLESMQVSIGVVFCSQTVNEAATWGGRDPSTFI